MCAGIEQLQGDGIPEKLAEYRTMWDGMAPMPEAWAGQMEHRYAEAVRAADMLQRASVIAFSQQAVQDIRRLEPELPCGWLHGKSASGDYQQRAAWIAEEAARCGTSLVDLNYNLLFPEVVAELRRRGLEVWTWTVNDPPVMQALSAWGVKSITTDRPDEAVRALGRAAPR